MQNQTIIDFSLPSTGNTTFQLASAKGRQLVIYFYHKDNTPGGTTEGQSFCDQFPAFQAANCDIVGISRDSLKSHESFKAKMAFPFELLSDSDETVCAQFGVMKLKNMYGKQVRGIERSTFIIDRNGILRKEWRGVKVPGHVEEVLAFVQTLN